MMNSTDNTDVMSVDTTVVMRNSCAKHIKQVDEEVAANDATKDDEEKAETSAVDTTTPKDDEDEASEAPDSRSEPGSDRDNEDNDEEKAGAKAVEKDAGSVTDTVHSEPVSHTEDAKTINDEDKDDDKADVMSTSGTLATDAYQAVLAPENRRRLVGCACGGCLLGTFFLFIILANTVLDTGYTCPQAGDLFEEFDIPPCTFEECFDSGCDPDNTPFVCFENGVGELHGGCSATPWDVIGSEGEPTKCGRTCDRSCCGALPIPDYIPTCDTQCSREWCENSHWCAPELAFQCIEGGAVNGCSWDPIQWTYHSVDCEECCNTNTCWNWYTPEEPEN